MINTTKKASEMIQEAIKNQETTPVIRIFKQEGCCGSSLGLMMDEVKEGDETITNRGIQYVINKDLLYVERPLKIDFVEGPGGSGFRVTSSLTGRSGFGGSCCG